MKFLLKFKHFFSKHINHFLFLTLFYEYKSNKIQNFFGFYLKKEINFLKKKYINNF